MRTNKLEFQKTDGNYKIYNKFVQPHSYQHERVAFFTQNERLVHVPLSESNNAKDLLKIQEIAKINGFHEGIVDEL